MPISRSCARSATPSRRRRDDDRYDRQLARAGFGLAPSFQQAGRRGDVREHQADRSAHMERGRSGTGEGRAAGIEAARAWPGLRSSSPSRGPCGDDRTGGGSDDIGDVSWNVPTVTLRYPVEHPQSAGSQLVERDHHGHAHCAQGRDRGRESAGDDDGRSADATGDSSLKPGTISGTVQTKETRYQPLISAQDQPAVWLNKKIMDEYRAQMRKFYYNPALYDTYLDQLGIRYPSERGVPPELRNQR